MTAAVITATAVQKINLPSNIISGSAERRLSRLYLEGTKETLLDWFLLSTYIGTTQATQIAGYGNVVKSVAGVYSTGTATLDTADYKLLLGTAGTGTVYAYVDYYE